MKKELVGGQAVINGVLMRSQHKIATAVRKLDNQIVYKEENNSKSRNKYSKYPFIRGLIALYDAMIIGTKELIFSANESGQEAENSTDKEIKYTLILSLLIAVGFFIFLPALISMILSSNRLVSNLIEAIIRITMFIGYIYFISKLKDIKTVFEYHGAEHKSIMCYESDLELTAENAKKMSRFHPRCGTSFLFLVIIVSIILYALIDVIYLRPQNIILYVIYKIFFRIILIPVIAAISFELQQKASKNLNNILSKIILYPGLLLQRLTTREPNLDQLEVAIVALKASLNLEVDNAVKIGENTNVQE